MRRSGSGGRRSCADGSIDGARLWREYRRRCATAALLAHPVLAGGRVRSSRLQQSTCAGAGRPEIPARGLDDRTCSRSTLVLSNVVLIILLVLVGDATILTWRFISAMKGGRTTYPRATVERFAAELGPECRPWRPSRSLPESPPATAMGRARATWTPGRNSLLDDWIDARLLAEHTAAIGPLIVFPFILVALAGRRPQPAVRQLGDRRSGAGSCLVCYVLWAIAMAAMLNIGAEMRGGGRSSGMEADLLWLRARATNYGAGRALPRPDRAGPQPAPGRLRAVLRAALVQAILVPLGGAGGVQLIEYLMFARAQ